MPRWSKNLRGYGRGDENRQNWTAKMWRKAGYKGKRSSTGKPYFVKKTKTRIIVAYKKNGMLVIKKHNR